MIYKRIVQITAFLIFILCVGILFTYSMRDHMSESVNYGFELNDTTWTKIVDKDNKLSYFHAKNKSHQIDNKGIFICLCKLSEAINNKGIFLRGGDAWTMSTISLYTGEIWAKSTQGEPLLAGVKY